jgi:hypothetical protein
VAELSAFEFIEQSKHEEGFLEVDEDIDRLVESPSEQFVLNGVPFVGVVDGGHVLGVGKRFLEWVLLDPLTVLLAEVVDLLAECIERGLLNSALHGLLFLLLFLRLLLLLRLLLHHRLRPQLILLQLVHVLLQVSKRPPCGLRVLLVVVDVVVELDEFGVLSERPLAEAVGVEIVLVALEVEEVLGDEVEVAQAGLEVALLQEGLPRLDDVPVVLQLVQRCLVPHEQSQYGLAQLRPFASHKELDADVVHESVGEVSLPRLVDGLQRS